MFCIELIEIAHRRTFKQLLCLRLVEPKAHRGLFSCIIRDSPMRIFCEIAVGYMKRNRALPVEA